MRFALTIKLGNDGMSSPYDVARALDELASDLKRNGLIGVGEVGIIRDVNGNRVGSWEVTP
jgi:predicted metal-dependent TIM-barrel fold hydrolase